MTIRSLHPAATAASAPVGERAASAPCAEPQDRATLGGSHTCSGSGCCGAAPVPSAKADVAEAGKPEYVPGQVIVKFQSGIAAHDVESFQSQFGLTTVRHFDIPESMQKAFGGELFQFALQPGETVDEAVKRLSGQPGVAFVEPNYKVQLDDRQGNVPSGAASSAPTAGERVPNDLDPKLWGLKNDGQDGGTAGVDIGAPAAWGVTTGKPNGQGPLIAIIDTGIDYSHPDLAANTWVNPGEIPGDGIDNDNNCVIDDVHGANLNGRNGNPMDDNAHGSHCAGTIGGVGDNGQGVAGVQWNATMAGVKFLDAGGSGSYADAIDAVLYATKIGARVTSNSWGGTGFSQALQDAFAASPALHLAAAGNSGVDADSAPHYPSGFPLDNIVSVAAHDRNDRLADFSNYGANSVDVAAPGVDVWSTVPGGKYDSFSGTSMATPHVAGVVGLMLSNDPALTNEQVKSRLLNTSVKGEAYQGKMVGGGRVNASATLETDVVPPAAPADFHISQVGATAMTLGWTATGDDGVEGKASSYKLRVSDRPFGTGEGEISFDKGTPVTGVPRPGEPGSAEAARASIEPSETGKTLYFALKVFDNVGNESGMVTVSGVSKPAAVAFRDDFEADGSWVGDGTWGRAATEGHGQVLSDSPDGAYGDNADTSVTSRQLDLSNVKGPRLLFDMKLDTEANYDFVHLEVSENGADWAELGKFDGFSDWKKHNLDLGAYEGKQIQVRFRLTSDGSISKDGVSIDNVLIAGDPA